MRCGLAGISTLPTFAKNSVLSSADSGRQFGAHQAIDAQETLINSPVRPIELLVGHPPELVEGLAERADYLRLNPIMVRQGL